MESIKISLDASGSNGEVSVVRVDGVIDTMTATELEKVMNSLLDQKRYNIVIDLGGVDYISSAGWGIFISNIREIRQNEGDIKLARMVPNVHEIFELLEFDSILHSFDNVEKARQEFLSTKGAERETEASRPSGSVSDKLSEATSSQISSAPATVVAEKTEKRVSVDNERAPVGRKAQDIESRVLDLVKDDPFRSISDMKKVLNSEDGVEKKVGWWKIWSILGRHDLRSKRKRFRYARG